MKFAMPVFKKGIAMNGLRNSWTLFYVRGIPIRAHVTLLAAIPYFALIISTQFKSMASLAAIDSTQLVLSPLVWGLLLAVGLFASVGLHELGHSLLALRSGRKVQSITLMLLGGISFIKGDDEEMESRQSSREASISVIGPVVSLVLSVLLYEAYLRVPIADLKFGFFYLSQLNMTIALFNLVPAFPLDGGRVLRALLARKMGFERATSTAVSIGKGFAVVFAMMGLLSFNIILLLVALFIYMAGVQEAKMFELRKMLAGLTAGDIMRAPSASLAASITVDGALRDLLLRHELYVPVVHGATTTSSGRMLGFVNVKSLIKIPEDRRSSIPVGMVADHDIAFLNRKDSAISAVKALLAQGPIAAVVDADGKLEGVIDQDAVTRSLELRRLFQTSRAA